VARVVIAAHDPDPRTDGDGAAQLRAAGIAVTTGVRAAEAEAQLAGFLTRLKLGRPHITLKLAVSLDGAIAMADGRSQWITGERARAAAHLERARADLIVVGRGTWDADQPRLDVRLPGLETRTPRMGIVGRSDGLPDHVTHFPDLAALTADPALCVLVEGGMGLAASLAAADLVDTLMLMRAPILIGAGRTLGDIGLASSLTKFAESYFARGGFPFSKFADLQETAVLIPDQPTPEAISTYLTAIGQRCLVDLR
jgi:diaminohydroxyphosphoribosylaminopyrimidine deaminase/5-amino-6-(5-phosphoribosylamino)uracil reductase